ncbi:MAG: RagB/SusD family nutrient uptake outer membrane protein [Odoribacter sp.]
MKKINIYIWVLLASIMTACSDWLDVKPFDQADEEQQYSQAQGFYNQLNGIYRKMASPELYGQELTWGFMDVLAQYYDMTNYSPCKNYNYRNLAKLDYEQPRVKAYFKKFWETTYNAIANCNNLIQFISVADSTLFPLRERERQCIEGEARALRGLLHFDLLRMFAPAPGVDSTGKYIPYVDYFPTHITQTMATNELLGKIMEDLAEGHRLTMSFDTLYVGNISNRANFLELKRGGDINRFMNFRGYRLNHYAIKGMLARVSLYRGNKAVALKWANDVYGYITKKWFRFTTESDIKYEKNMKLYGDVLFALYNNNLTLYESKANDGVSQLAAWDYDGLFAGDNTRDFRRYQWYEDKGNDYWAAYKYKEVDKSYDYGEYSNPMIPVLRCSEICYIIAECSYESNKAYAESILNYVRKSRGCRSTLEQSNSLGEFIQLIQKDYRREFYGEGQLFYFYKRLGLDAVGDGRNLIKYGQKFVFPIPESEDI